MLCADGPVTSRVELTLTAEHRRGHGAIYDAVNHGWLEPHRLRRLLHVSWLRPEARNCCSATSTAAAAAPTR
ncbi:hypothetical protein [Streptomyces sp. NPDC059753]|uniref:hypothetical protein n=1 Tax=Streptomyces sp. NPDC059753 TaxID=3346933 RepID=UPI00365AD21B